MIEALMKTDEFVIDTDAKAAWALTKIKEARDDRDEWVAFYEGKIEEIKAQTDFDTMNLERMLAEYFATVKHKVTKTQESYALKNGKLILKKQNPEYKRDDKTAIAWLKENGGGQFIKTKEELDWSALKDASGVVDGKVIFGETVNEDGEIVQIAVPGIEVIDREDKFVVEVK